LLKLKEKLEQPAPIPELYNEEAIERERQSMEPYFRRSSKGNRLKIKVEKEHQQKYERYWQKSHSAKLSTLKKYDLSEAKYKELWKCP